MRSEWESRPPKQNELVLNWSSAVDFQPPDHVLMEIHVICHVEAEGEVMVADIHI